MSAAALTVRPIMALSEMHAVEDMQLAVWGFSEREVIPALFLRASLEVGGILLGAFDAERLAGFAYGYVGWQQGRPIIHSDMLAVLPEYRDQGLGQRLKWAQRTQALAQGIATMTWTFDPLQRRNAALNFAKLGAVSYRYLPDFYGETGSKLHAGGTDRLWMTWHLDSHRVRERLSGAKAPVWDAPWLLATQDDHPKPQRFPEAAALRIATPENWTGLQQCDAALARAWRDATREAFTVAMERGYRVEEFQDGAYVLQREAA